MATQLQDKKGNEEDKLNPSKKGYDELYPAHKLSEAEHDAASGLEDQFAAPAINNEDRNTKGKHVDAHGDEVQNNYNADKVKDKEENPSKPPRSETDSDSSGSGAQKSKSRFSKLLNGKRFGATGGIAGLLIASFGGASLILAPGALMIAIEKAVTNDGSDSTRFNIVMRRAYIGGLFSGKGDCSKKTVMCRATTISQKQKENWEKKGFKIEADEINGRHKIKSIEWPDGHISRDAKDFHNHAENTVEGRRHANRVLNVRAAFFQNAKFNKVLKNLNLSKGKIIEASRDRDKNARTEAMNQSFDENIDATSGDKNSRMSKIKDRIKQEASGPASSVKSKVVKRGLNPATNATSIACGMYDATRIAIATTKAIWISDLIRFAFPFVQAAAQMEDQGNIEPEVVELLADRLTWFMTEEEAKKRLASGDDPLAMQKVNKTATDAQGLQMAIYGDTTALKEISKAYTTGMIGGKVVGSASSAVTTIQEIFGGKENIRTICQGNSAVGFVTGLAQSAKCAAAGPVSAAICGAMAVGVVGGAYAFGDKVIMEVVEFMIDDAVEAIANANLNSSLKGVDAGNALAAGIGLMLSSSSMGYGLRPAASVAAVEGYISKTDELNYTYTDQIAMDEARENPFDMTNKFSFVGQLASAFNSYSATDKSFYGRLMNGFATVTSPLTNMSTASALYSQPSNMTAREGAAENRLEKMVDPQMAEIGAVNDWSGRMVGVVPDEVLTKAAAQGDGAGNMNEETINYMLKAKYITDDGKDNSSTKDNKYAKWKEYCTEDRKDPLGTTTQSIMGGDNAAEEFIGVDVGGSEDDDWYTGKKCVGSAAKTALDSQGKLVQVGTNDSNAPQAAVSEDDDMLNHFAIYYNLCESQIATAEETENCWDESATPTAAVQNTGGDWVIPTSGPCTSPYGPRWGTIHAGIDIASNESPPIVAPTSMRITGVTEGWGGGYGTNVTAVATDGTGYSFRFAHMVPGSPKVSVNQEVSKGAEIGTMGTSGDSTGIHLHFEVFPPGGGLSGAVDPVPILQQNGVIISC